MKFLQNQGMVKSPEQFEKGCFPMRGGDLTSLTFTQGLK